MDSDDASGCTNECSDGGNDGEGARGSGATGTSTRTRVGARAERRLPGTGGVLSAGHKATNEDSLIACVTQVANKFVAMSDADVGFSAVRVEDVVRNEVRSAVSEAMAVIKALLDSTHRWQYSKLFPKK